MIDSAVFKQLTINLMKIDPKNKSGIANIMLADFPMEIRGFRIYEVKPGQWSVTPPSVYVVNKKTWFCQVWIHDRKFWETLERCIIELFLKHLPNIEAISRLPDAESKTTHDQK